MTYLTSLKEQARAETKEHCQRAYVYVLPQSIIDSTVDYWSARTDTIIETAFAAGKESERERILNILGSVQVTHPMLVDIFEAIIEDLTPPQRVTNSPMELKSQVVSLELARHLDKLGVKQESLFYWNENDSPAGGSLFEISDSQIHKDTTDYANYSAFTVSELGGMISHAKSQDVIKAYGHVWNVPGTQFITELGFVSAMRDPEIGAAMLIYLLENHLITL